ncbi:hypothetical protein L1049_020231 [Liquidambar formosana]|uniref:MATH domain-containing protein n=1 Tax=Liquidambar formosana TaxID=63359 RepID=A0AAP0X782_LIQFO
MHFLMLHSMEVFQILCIDSGRKSMIGAGKNLWSCLKYKMDSLFPDTLEIRAQVQIIREKAHRPFRCLDRQYRRELVRVYLTNVEQICRRFVEERRGKLGKLIEDRVRWLSFCNFWMGVDQNTRHLMSREKTDVILRVVVKHFFVEKEVTSTLVMDSLNSGLKALEAQSRSKKGKANLLDIVETSAPIVRVEDDMFILADDVLSLLERAALELSPPKDEKGPQNRTKDGNFGEDFNKDSIERDERRLTELGRRTVEIFVLAHIFSNKIEVAYQEAVALKRQEELIREEEAAGLAEIEQRAKRRVAEKEKRSKKKLNKQKKSSRKGKDRGKDDKFDVEVQEQNQQDSPSDERIEESSSVKLAQSMPEKPNALEDVSDVSDIEDDVGETLQFDTEDRDAGPVNWDTYTTDAHPSMESFSIIMNGLPVQNGHTEKSSPLMDDSSSTCSTDSVTSVVINGPCKGNSLLNYKSQKSPSRAENQGVMETNEQINRSTENNSLPGDPAMNAGHRNDASGSSDSAPEFKAALSLKDHVQRLEQTLVKKEVVVSLPKKLCVKDQVDVDRPSKQMMVAEVSLSPRSSTKSVQPKSVPNSDAVPVSVRGDSLINFPQTDTTVSPIKQKPQILVMSKPDVQKTTSKPVCSPIENLTIDQVPVRSRPSSTLVPGCRPTAPMVLTAPSLSWSVSAARQLDPDRSPQTPNFVPQSYRNAILTKTLTANVTGLLPSSSSAENPLLAYSQSPALKLSPQSSTRTDQGLAPSGFTFGSVAPEVLHNETYWTDACQDNATGTPVDSSSLNCYQNSDGPGSRGLQADFTEDFPYGESSRQSQRASLDEFPHLDIINYLLDEELGNGKAANGSYGLNESQ